MSFKVAVISGKGGTGKTTISAQLAMFLAQKNNILLLDCDVEEPNSALFFQNKKTTKSKIIYQDIAEIELDKCKFCKKCVAYCNYNAITIIPKAKFAQVDKNLCHSCGACTVACQHNAIIEIPEPIGEINSYEITPHFNLMEGRLKIGSTKETMLIKSLKKEAQKENKWMILDAPPGTSCAVVETISDVDEVIVVAEPTPFGMHDVQLTIKLLRQINKPFGIITNKSGLGNYSLDQVLNKENISFTASIPFSKEMATQYASGELSHHLNKNMEQIFTYWWNDLNKRRTI